MKTIIFVDGTSLEASEIIGKRVTHNGIERDCLDFVLVEPYDFTTILNKFTEENCESITITEGENSYTHNGYVIRVGIGITLDEQSFATAESDAVYHNVLHVEMAQKVHIEYENIEYQTALEEAYEMLFGMEGEE